MSAEVKPEAGFDFADWVADGIRGARHTIQTQAVSCGLPDPFWEHAHASRREALLALRALVDVAIERVQSGAPAPTSGDARRQRGTKIEVQ